jgi:signal transduction histidine kinase
MTKPSGEIPDLAAPPALGHLTPCPVGMGYWLYNAYGVLQWGPGCEALLGHPGEAGAARQLAAGLGAAQWQAWQRWLTQCLPTPERPDPDERADTLLPLTFRRADGQLRHLAARAVGHTQPDGTALAGVFWDQTAQREMSQQLEEGNQSLQRLSHQLLMQEKNLLVQLARHLHDHLGQTLTALRFQIEGLAPGPSPEGLQRVRELAQLASQQVRKTLTDLRPPLLDEGGLVLALEDDMAQMRQTWSGQPTRLLLQAEPHFRRLPAAVEYAFFMIAREAVFNALQHAGAQLIEVRLRERAAQEVELTVTDDGCGLPAARKAGHLGMVTMHERATAIGARLCLRNLPSGGVDVSLRWQPAEPA